MTDSTRQDESVEQLEEIKSKARCDKSSAVGRR